MLQNEVFYKLHVNKEIEFLGRSSFVKRLDHNPVGHVLNSIIRLDEATFSERREFLSQELYRLLDQNKLNVISEEMLSVVRISDGLDFKRNLNRLRDLTRDIDTHYLIVSRKQEELIYSLFIEYLGLGGAKKSFGHKSLSDFVQSGLSSAKNGAFKIFYFDDVVKVIGQDFCTVLPYELLSLNPNLYAEKIATLLGVEMPESEYDFGRAYNVNSSQKRGKRSRTSLNTYVNRFFAADSIGVKALRQIISVGTSSNLRRKLLNRMRGVKFKGAEVPFMSAAQIEQIRQAFAGSNDQLSVYSKINLNDFGYSSENEL